MTPLAPSQNVLISDSGTPVLADFGFAKSRDATQYTVAGSEFYWPPECELARRGEHVKVRGAAVASSSAAAALSAGRSIPHQRPLPAASARQVSNGVAWDVWSFGVLMAVLHCGPGDGGAAQSAPGAGCDKAGSPGDEMNLLIRDTMNQALRAGRLGPGELLLDDSVLADMMPAAAPDLHRAVARCLALHPDSRPTMAELCDTVPSLQCDGDGLP